MRIEYVKTITYTCPVCNTSIKFNVEPDWNSMKELFDTVDNLTCPKCKEDLSYEARTVFDATKDYNDAVKKLLSAEKESNATLG